MIDYDRIPATTIETLERWVSHGYEPGSFVTAVLKNDLYGACRNADQENAAALYEIVCWLVNKAPMGCWGSAANVSEWATLKRDERNAAALAEVRA